MAHALYLRKRRRSLPLGGSQRLPVAAEGVRARDGSRQGVSPGRAPRLASPAFRDLCEPRTCGDSGPAAALLPLPGRATREFERGGIRSGRSGTRVLQKRRV